MSWKKDEKEYKLQKNRDLTYYFKDRSEIDDLPLEVYVKLQSAYQELSVDPLEGKDSGVTDTSSDLSDSPESPATEPASSPEESTA